MTACPIPMISALLAFVLLPELLRGVNGGSGKWYVPRSPVRR
jgi:hypothetical protein